MISTAGLMDLDVYIPTFSCSLTFNLNEQNKGSRMKLVAEFITDVYSKCSKCEADYAKDRIQVKLAFNKPLFTLLPPSCTYNFEYSEYDYNEKLKDASTFVADIYSRFPELSPEQKKNLEQSGFLFSDIDLNPDRKPCIGLRQALIENVEQDIKIYKSATLQTDSSPKYTLKKVAESLSNGILFVNSFPLYSETTVTILKSEIKVEMRFNRDF